MPIIAGSHQARRLFVRDAKQAVTSRGCQWPFLTFRPEECFIIRARRVHPTHRRVGKLQNRVFWSVVTHQDPLEQGIFFGWQRVAGGHFCIITKIGGLFHPVNLIFTTKPRGHKRRSRSSITWSSATMLFRRKRYCHGAARFKRQLRSNRSLIEFETIACLKRDKWLAIINTCQR